MKTQVWCALATNVLIAIVQKELQLEASLYTCLQIFSVSVFEKTQLSCALQADAPHIDPLDAANQSKLFNLYPDSSGTNETFQCPAGASFSGLTPESTRTPQPPFILRIDAEVEGGERLVQA